VKHFWFIFYEYFRVLSTETYAQLKSRKCNVYVIKVNMQIFFAFFYLLSNEDIANKPLTEFEIPKTQSFKYLCESQS
jgi:hypothetical protein